MNAQSRATLPVVVRLDVPADASFVSLLRITAAALAARMNFAIDQIEDLRVMVDEAASLLLMRAAVPSTVACRYILDEDEVTLVLSAVPQDRKGIETEGFAWLVLDTLADAVDARLTDDGIEIEVHQKRRMVANESSSEMADRE